MALKRDGQLFSALRKNRNDHKLHHGKLQLDTNSLPRVLDTRPSSHGTVWNFLQGPFKKGTFFFFNSRDDFDVVLLEGRSPA